MQHSPRMEHYKSNIKDKGYQINRYQWFNFKPNRENMGSVSKSRRLTDSPLNIALVSLQAKDLIIAASYIDKRYMASKNEDLIKDLHNSPLQLTTRVRSIISVALIAMVGAVADGFEGG